MRQEELREAESKGQKVSSLLERKEGRRAGEGSEGLFSHKCVIVMRQERNASELCLFVTDGALSTSAVHIPLRVVA